jgi:hypothetical protein
MCKSFNSWRSNSRFEILTSFLGYVGDWLLLSCINIPCNYNFGSCGLNNIWPKVHCFYFGCVGSKLCFHNLHIKTWLDSIVYYNSCRGIYPCFNSIRFFKITSGFAVDSKLLYPPLMGAHGIHSGLNT